MKRVILAVLSVVCLYAQGTTSRVGGTVLDSSGSPVPRANVKLINEDTLTTFATVTSDAGTYVFDSVQVGNYTIEVDATGFKKFTSRHNPLSIGQPMTVNVTLEVGAITESVEVNASAEQVQTDTSGNIGDLLTGRAIRDLPIVGTRGRNPIDLVLIMPGVVNGANTGGGIHVNGARDRSWNYTVDGIDSNETSAGGSDLSPVRVNPDSLAEFRVITSNPTAEYGRNSGGQVAMITSSGTNEIHGSGFWFYRTPRLNANEYSFNINGLGKSQFVQNIYGGSIGGPIIKNRWFVFTNVQALAALNTYSVNQLVYTATARAGVLRYADGGRNRPCCIAGASVDASGNPLAGVSIGSYNVIANDPQHIGLDKTVSGLIAQTPLPNNYLVGDGLNTAGYNFSAPQRERQHDETFKTDFIINSKNTVFFRGSWGSQDTNCDNANGGLAIFPGTQCIVTTVREPRSFAANWRWNPRPDITNEVVFGQNHYTFAFQQPADITKIGINAPVPTLAVYDYANTRTITTWQAVDNFTWARGTHTFKFGTNLRFQRHQDIRGSVGGYDSTTDVNFSTGVNTVDPATFGIPSGVNTTFDLPTFQSNINFLLGRVGDITRGFVAQGNQFVPGLLLFDARWPEYDFYAQDTWKVSRRLTVDLGLRWEIRMSPSSPSNNITHPNLAMVAGGTPSTNVSWTSGKLYPNAFRDLGPSIGVAFDPLGDGKSSVRANYRIAYDRLNTFSLSSAVFANLPGTTFGIDDQSYGQGGGRLTGLQSLAPPTLTPSQLLTPAPYSSSAITVVDPNFKMPITHEWGLSVQREIARSTIVEVDYIGRRAYHLFGAYNANQAQIFNNGFIDAFNTVKAGGDSPLIDALTQADSRRGATETGSQMVRRLFASTLSLNSVGALASSLGSRIQNGKSVLALSGQNPFFFFPYPQFSGGVNVIDSNDFSTYHSLQAQVQRRFRGGLEAQFSYTLSKSLDTRSYDPAFTIVSGANNQSASSTPIDINNRRLNYAPSDFDRTHVIQSYWVYEVPFGKGKQHFGNSSGMVQRLVGGWEIGGFLTAESGRPMTVYSGANTVSNVRQTPANCAGNCSRSLGQVFNDPASSFIYYFNADQRAQFTTPGPGDFSNTGRNYFRGPGFFDIDATFAKKIYFTERYYLQIRADASNLLNHPSFSFPTLTITSTTFGQIRSSTDSASRKFQLGAKFYF
ncbi:MAG TPA: TonB-dependent receptor [Bryobacteraceae bacterium]